MKEFIKTAEDGKKSIVFNATKMNKSDKRTYGVPTLEQMLVLRTQMFGDKNGFDMTVDKVLLSSTILAEIGLLGIDRVTKTVDIPMYYGEAEINASMVKTMRDASTTPSIMIFDAHGAQGFEVPEKVKKRALKKFASGEEYSAQEAAVIAMLKGFWLDTELMSASLTKHTENAQLFRVFLMTPSGHKSAKGFACPDDFTEEGYDKYHPDVRPVAATLKGAAAMLNHLTNGFIAEKILSDKIDPAPEVLNKMMARFGLLMSGGQSYDITSLDLKYQMVNGVSLPLPEVEHFMEESLTLQYGAEESPRKARARANFRENYKEAKGDGMFIISSSAMARFKVEFEGEKGILESISKSCVGKNYITRIVMHTKSADEHTGCVIVKGLGLVVPDEILQSHPIYAGCDIIMTAETVKLNTLPSGIATKTYMQICRESSTRNSNNTNAQAISMMEGNMSEMNSIESIKVADETLKSIYTPIIDAAFNGLTNGDDMLATLKMFKKNSSFLRRIPLETFTMKMAEIGGEALKSPLVRKAYSNVIAEKLKGMQNGKIPFDGSFELIVNDPFMFFPAVERFEATGRIIFGRPEYKVSLLASDMLLTGCKDCYKGKIEGQILMVRNPCQSPGQLVLGNFVSGIELAERLSSHPLAKAWMKLYSKLEGVAISGTGIIEGVLGGADFDGDIVLCFWDKRFSKLVTTARIACIAQDSKNPAKKELLTTDNLSEFMATSIKVNAVGILSNWASVIRDIAIHLHGALPLDERVLDAIREMKSKAFNELKVNSQGMFTDALTTMANMDMTKKSSIVAAMEKSYQVIATLVMQEVDSTKSGISVNPKDFEWLKPAYKEGKKDILVVPHFFKYATAVKRKKIQESASKYIYQSLAPLGNLTTNIFDAEAKLYDITRRVYKGESLFGEVDPVIWDTFLDKAEEYAEVANELMDKYETDDSTSSRTEELKELASSHRQYWQKAVLDNNWTWEAISAVMEGYTLELPDGSGKFLSIYPVEVLGDKYFKCVNSLVKEHRKELVPVKMFEVGYLPVGNYQLVSDIVYKDEVAIGKTKTGVPDGEYKLQKLGNVCYLSKVTAPNSKWVGHTFRIFGSKIGAVDAAVLRSAIVANDSIVAVQHDYVNATVTIGTVIGKLSEKDGIVGGHNFKVEIIGETASSLTLKVISEI